MEKKITIKKEEVDFDASKINNARIDVISGDIEITFEIE